jgi:transposase
MASKVRNRVRNVSAELLTHIQQTNSQYNLPDIGPKIAYKTNRAGVAERLADPAVPKSIEVALALIDYDDHLLRALEVAMVQTAKQHEANTLYWLQTGPGIGKLLSLVLLYEMHAIARLPRVPDFVSYGRLVQCAQASAGKRYGTSGTKLGNAYLTWAFSEAALLCLRNHPAGQKYLTRLEKTHGQGKALTVLAHKLARAVSYMLKHGTAFEMDRFLQGSGSAAGEPAAELGHHGVSLTTVLGKETPPASAHAPEHIGAVP